MLRLRSVEELAESEVARGRCSVACDVSVTGLTVLGKAAWKALDQEWRTFLGARVHGNSEDRNKVL